MEDILRKLEEWRQAAIQNAKTWRIAARRREEEREREPLFWRANEWEDIRQSLESLAALYRRQEGR